MSPGGAKGTQFYYCRLCFSKVVWDHVIPVVFPAKQGREALGYICTNCKTSREEPSDG